jgi:hypothetical protein
MSTVEHKVAMYQLATGRRKAGLPVWAHTIDVSYVFHNDELSFEDKRAEIVAVIKRSRWYKDQDPATFDGLVDLVDNLETDDADSFDYWWNEIYDIADYDRVWIKTQ